MPAKLDAVRSASEDGLLTASRSSVERVRQVPEVHAQQKTELVLASLRGPKTIAELCREHDISESLLRKWREQFPAAGAERLHGTTRAHGGRRAAPQIARLERALGRKTMEADIAGELLRDWEERPGCRSRAAAAQALRGPPAASGLLSGDPTGCALAPRHDQRLGLRARLVLPQRRDRLLHTGDRRLGAGRPLPRSRSGRGHRRGARAARRRRRPAHPRHGDNGTAFTSRAFRARLAQHGVVHRRGGYRDPESQAFIEPWFSKLEQRCIWREEFKTLDEARVAIGAYVEHYHHRPHQGRAYRTPRDVAQTWKDQPDPPIRAA